MSIISDEFKSIYSVSGNLQGLRDKILDLAVRGKLIEQGHEVESAEELYDRIISTKKVWEEEGRIKKSKKMIKPSREDLDFDIPESWSAIRLVDLARFIDYRGRTPKKTDDGVPLITAKNIKYGYIDDNPREFISQDDYDGWMTRGIPDFGNVIITTEAPLANVARLLRNDKYALAQRAITLNTYITAVDGYLYRALMSPLIRECIFSLATGTTVLGIKASKLKDVVIPLPPLDEQKRIEERVEELFELIDVLEHKLKNKELIVGNLSKAVVETIGKARTSDELNEQLKIVIDNFACIFDTSRSIKELRKVILQLAIEGKLVVQDPSDEQARDLISRIKSERDQLVKSKIIKKPKKYPTIDELEAPFVIPDSWQWIRLNEVTEINPRNKLDDDLDVSFIPMKLMSDGFGSYHESEVKKWKGLKKGYTHFAENDIAVAKITPCFENRKSAILKGLTSGFGAGTTEFHIVRVYSTGIDRRYLLNIFKTQWFIDQGVSTFSGTAGQQRVSTDFMKELLIPIPPFQEQIRIINKLNVLMKLIDALEDKLTTKGRIVSNLGKL